jgi:hypothetical protein
MSDKPPLKHSQSTRGKAGKGAQKRKGSVYIDPRGLGVNANTLRPLTDPSGRPIPATRPKPLGTFVDPRSLKLDDRDVNTLAFAAAGASASGQPRPRNAGIRRTGLEPNTSQYPIAEGASQSAGTQFDSSSAARARGSAAPQPRSSAAAQPTRLMAVKSEPSNSSASLSDSSRTWSDSSQQSTANSEPI